MKKKVLTFLSLVFAVVMFAGCSLFAGEDLQRQVLTTSEQEQRIQNISQTYPDAVVTVFKRDIASDTHSALGSGVVVKDNGFIVTNYHVISLFLNSNQYQLEVVFNDSVETHEATIEWNSAALDLAILKVDLFGLDFVPMKDRSIKVLEEDHYFASEIVVAIGTPIDFSLQNTVTVGRIASDKHRVAFAEGNVYHDLIQHTAPINHGNSGGGLFDLDGNLIALNTLGNDNANSLFFAVPVYALIEVLPLVETAYLNGTKHTAGLIGIEALDKEQASHDNNVTFEDSGMLVISVFENGSANGKLVVGDIIRQIKIGDKTVDVENRNSLVFALLKTKSGTNITLKVERNNSNINVNITLG